MSFLTELKKQKNKLKETQTVVTNVDGKRFVEHGNESRSLPRTYGFVVDTKPDDIPVLITDYVYIGAQDCAASNVIQNFNIKHVLSLGINVQVEVNSKFVDCLDLPDTDIRTILIDALPFLRNAVLGKENVLVHCNAGVSRTSMVAIGYLIHYEDMTFVKAYSLVKEKRPAIQPNAGFRKQLEKLVPGRVIQE